jgi:hypothetical protein
MSDRLYLSCWVRGFDESNMLKHYSKLLSVFPFSKLAKQTQTVRVYAVEYAEPPAGEKPFEMTAAQADLLDVANDFMAPDCACDLETWWDLWQMVDGEWKLAPSGVTLTCLGPEFDNENSDNLRIDFGLDAKFLPQPGVEASLRMQQSNLRSLLHLSSEIEKALPLSRRQLWSESGVNFADLLAQVTGEFRVN